ncbi:hypothetical protein TNCV_4153291 [Trichonephila clavipes]|nr:hypothetical protein TNCV_4153291 [Trichonephila clavipes]
MNEQNMFLLERRNDCWLRMALSSSEKECPHITPRKKTGMVTLSQHTCMTLRDIAAAVGIGKYSVSRVINQQKNFGVVFLKRNSKCGRKRHHNERWSGWVCCGALGIGRNHRPPILRRISAIFVAGSTTAGADRFSRCKNRRHIMSYDYVAGIRSFEYRFGSDALGKIRPCYSGAFGNDLVILNHGQVTRTTPELAPSSPNYHTTSTGGRFSSRQI